jgi:hypothetical protein
MGTLGGQGRARACVEAYVATSTLVVMLAVAALAGCGGHAAGPSHPDADAATNFDARDAGLESSPDTPADAPASEAAACKGSDAGTKMSAGQACGCASDCASNFCVDGVCCSTACTEACKTCAAPGSPGTCTFLVSGATPRDPTACVAAAASTCGFDGTCDGSGACRRHVAGTICKPGMCDGAAVVGALACDGFGRCKAGPTTICAPYSCDPDKGACFEACTQTTDCASGQQCVNASCGKKMKGANCTKGADCASGFCADGVCCNVACGGACVSCALPDRKGTCWPIDHGVADPRGQCVDQGASSCGATGTCDGFGGCEKYAAETICLAASCTGTRRNTPGTCDGLGTCRPQGVQNCGPFLCQGGACTQSCVTDIDCESGHACVNGTCGKKNLGVTCAADGECLSGTCVEGVCCDGKCDGACKSCALASTMGHCTPLAAGAVDSKGVCADQGATTCGTNGRCDGSGGCQKYKPGTVCAPESCSGNVYTPPSTCSATGQCAPPDSLPCAPYTCNGNTCFNACATDNNCVSPNVCNGNSCGKKMRGASCSNASECQSTFCAQGVCCDTACAGACTSCALTGSLGTCTNVPNNAPDPADLCADQGPASCGTNGKCQAGVCQKYAQGTACAASTCPASTTTFTPGSTCDGRGACVTPNASSCFPFECGAGVCKNACTTDADCATPAVCIAGSCGLKGLGKTCADGSECLSTFCAQGVCCDSACGATCTSCVLSGSLGRCANVADGNSDPRGRCVDQGASSCGNDGACDGKGACRVYAAGTACAAASCPASSSTLTQVRTCDGAGTCKPATTLSCAPYLCNGISACKAACTVDADCLAPDICDPQTNLCGNKRRLGQTCGATSDCLTGNFCVDGVCCASSSCALCQTCATGSCANVGAGVHEPHDGCAPNPPCGNTGNCNGGGACEQASTNVACGTGSCMSSTFTPVSHCTGTGTCATPSTSSCSPYVCGTNACKVTCALDADCVPPFTCQGAGASRSCALKANGLACGAGNQCISGNCVDGVCCGSPSCPACQACNLSGTGACAPLPAGTAAPASFCTDHGASMCSTDGKCDGAGNCEKYPNNTPCAPPVCSTGAFSLTLAGACSGGTCVAGSQTCNGFKCTGGTSCPTTCATDTDCDTSGYYCSGGSCVPKIGQGGACTADDQCGGTTKCVDNVCCGSSTCGSCQACNVPLHVGTCWPLAMGTTDPKGVCVDKLPGSCDTNGKCDGAGNCQKYPNGTTCNDGNACTQTDTCQAGACSGGNPVTCTAQDQCHAVGACDPATGTCSNPNKPDGAACNDGNACTQTDTCQAGACSGGNPVVCTASDQCHTAGTCSPATGACSNPNKADGSGCNDGNACTQTDTCQAGACSGGNPVVCTASDQCHTAGTCSPATGACSNPNKADGAACNDGNACNQTDTCQAGVCVGGNPVVCTASDQCHTAGTCSPATGACSNPNKADGSGCNDGNACTQTDTCQAGACTGGNPVICTASDQCHTAGTCSPATGACSNPNKPDGSGCNDGDACTQTDTCVAGTCTGANPVVCTASDQCHLVGTCDSMSGVCSNLAKMDGTPCNDGNACTQTDACQAGACMGNDPVVCTASDQCHVAGACNPADGSCTNPAQADGTTCNDGDACTQTDTCVTGVCTGGNPVVCTASDQCHVAGTCTPATGVCTNPTQADGTTCNDNDACTQTDTCQAGICSGANPVVCTALDVCHLPGTCESMTGVCSNPPACPDPLMCDGTGACF